MLATLPQGWYWIYKGLIPERVYVWTSDPSMVTFFEEGNATTNVPLTMLNEYRFVFIEH